MTDRYEILWQNGFWSMFDRRQFAPVDTFPTKEWADEALASARKEGRWRYADHAIYEHPWKLSAA